MGLGTMKGRGVYTASQFPDAFFFLFLPVSEDNHYKMMARMHSNEEFTSIVPTTFTGGTPLLYYNKFLCRMMKTNILHVGRDN